MESMSIKIKLATVLAISVLVGAVLYAKADKIFLEKENETDRYSIKSDPSTNLDATLNAHPRASEYIASSEYTSKMAPTATGATEYLAMNESGSISDGDYQRRAVPAAGQRPHQSSSDTYQDFGVRSAVTKNKSAKVVQSQANEDKTYERKSVETDYSKAVNNATTSDVAYQVKSVPQNSGQTHGGYAVRSVGGKSTSAQSVTNKSNKESFGGYAVRSAARGGAKVASEMTAEGYVKRPAPYSNHTGFFDEMQTGTYQQRGGQQLTHYDNAKQGDAAYKVKSVPQNSGQTHGGYAVRSAGGKSSSRNVAMEGQYQRRSAPQGQGANITYAQGQTPARSAESEYGGYAVRSAGGRDINKSAVTNSSNNESFGGYAVRSAGGKSSSRNVAMEGQYQRKTVPQGQGANIAQYDNASRNDNAYQVKSISQNSGESYGGYAVRSAGGRDVSKSAVANSSSNDETFGGYTVRSAGGNNNRRSTHVSQAPRSTIYDGTKVYNSKGQRVSLSTRQQDRTVIVMPIRGRAITGIVVQDDPGRSIVVQANSGAQSTFRYGEIDALVNL